MSWFKQITQKIAGFLPGRRAQSLVEFALALPVLLMLVFGIIEFGRMMQAWLAMENGARFAVRYAITGSYNPTYCAAADEALNLSADDSLDGNVDCRVPNTDPDWETKSEQLQDWARLSSIRDTALSGAMGISWDPSADVSGDYLAYLDNAYNTADLSQDYRGNPSLPGYFNISTCSNRVIAPAGDTYRFNANPFSYDPIPPDETADNYSFPLHCELAAGDNSGVIRNVDDAGGPGDRVRIILTYRHNLITPFLSSMWPTLRLTSQREGVVEKFRTSRVTGLSGAIAYAPTWTPTVTSTLIPSITPTPTTTATATLTATPACNTITFNNSEPLYLNTGSDKLNMYIYNQSSFNVTLTGASGRWLSAWHTDGSDTRAANQITAYGWDAGGYSQFWSVPSASRVSLTSPIITYNHNPFGTTKSVPAGYSGYVAADFLANFAQASSFGATTLGTYNYYHGSDFEMTLKYTVGGISCSTTVTGLAGPVINDTVYNTGGKFSVDSGATAARSIQYVYFYVFDSAGTYVHYLREGAGPYCIFGDSGGTCTKKTINVDTWSKGALIANGTYTVVMVAMDNGGYATRHQVTVVFNAPTPTKTLTRTVTRTPTITFTPSKTSTPTRTFTVTQTPTITKTFTKTNTRTITPTRTNTVVFTATNTRTPTRTATRCLTPIEIGGCQ